MNYLTQKIGMVSTLHKCFYYGGISTLCCFLEAEINFDYNAYLIYTIQIKLVDSIL